MGEIDVAAFYRDGYAVLPVLTAEEAAQYAAIADAYVSERNAGDKRDFLLVEQLPQVLGHPQVQGALAQILGSEDLVLETWTLMAVEEGGCYKQGWHRDIPLGSPWLPQGVVTQLLEAIATGRWHHNNVQCNLALTPDACYWVVPGSNRRAFTEAEHRVFAPIIAAESHLASRPDETDAGIEGGVCVAVKPGEMILQNNVSIHRGWGNPARHRRRTLHFGFHSAHRAPTWHFRRRLNDQFDRMTAYERGAMDPLMRTLLERRAERMAGLIPSEPGDEAWRRANLQLFFSGGLKSD